MLSNIGHNTLKSLDLSYHWPYPSSQVGQRRHSQHESFEKRATIHISFSLSIQTRANSEEDFNAMQDFLEAIKHQGKNPEATREFFQGLGAGFQHLADKVVGASIKMAVVPVNSN